MIEDKNENLSTNNFKRNLHADQNKKGKKVFEVKRRPPHTPPKKKRNIK